MLHIFEHLAGISAPVFFRSFRLTRTAAHRKKPKYAITGQVTRSPPLNDSPQDRREPFTVISTWLSNLDFARPVDRARFRRSLYRSGTLKSLLWIVLLAYLTLAVSFLCWPLVSTDYALDFTATTIVRFYLIPTACSSLLFLWFISGLAISWSRLYR